MLTVQTSQADGSLGLALAAAAASSLSFRSFRVYTPRIGSLVASSFACRLLLAYTSCQPHGYSMKYATSLRMSHLHSLHDDKLRQQNRSCQTWCCWHASKR